jgi:hypothetical protein
LWILLLMQVIQWQQRQRWRVHGSFPLTRLATQTCQAASMRLKTSRQTKITLGEKSLPEWVGLTVNFASPNMKMKTDRQMLLWVW